MRGRSAISTVILAKGDTGFEDDIGCCRYFSKYCRKNPIIE